MDLLVPILVPTGFMTATVLIAYFFLSYSHKERMQMLKMGLTPPPTRGGITGMSSLWMGLVSIAIGAALLISQTFAYDKEHIVGGIVFAFIGVGLMVYYQITAPKREQEIRLREEYQAGLMRQVETLRANTVLQDGSELG
jgi:hypothetical protein